MCMYCNIGDWAFRQHPPFPAHPFYPYVPAPTVPGPHEPWKLDKVKELEDILKRVKALENELGCPCEPAKADYLTILRDRITHLEKQVAEKKDYRYKMSLDEAAKLFNPHYPIPDISVSSTDSYPFTNSTSDK